MDALFLEPLDEAAARRLRRLSLPGGGRRLGQAIETSELLEHLSVRICHLPASGARI